MPAHRRAPETTTTKPLKPAVFHILLALAGRDNYGYALMQAVREASDGHVPLSPGSFSRAMYHSASESLRFWTRSRTVTSAVVPPSSMSP